jgi:CubicO group peptidase (beta-lactamase class C family)
VLPDLEQDLRRLHKDSGLTAVAAGYRLLGNGASEGASEEDRISIAAAGKRRSDQPDLVSPDDLWHVGSVTKSMTATLLATLQDVGLLSFTDKLAELLPGMTMHEAWHEVTLLSLLTHTAGLPANLPLSARSNDPTSDDLRLSMRADLLAKVLAKPPRFKPGTQFTYSNVGYTLAGHCAEVCTQQPFRTLLRERVWQPLGMDSAGFGPPLAPALGQEGRTQPLGHRALWRWRFPQDPSQGQVDNTSIIDPAGCTHMSIKDLLAFGSAHLAGRWPALRVPVLQDYACGWVLRSPQPRAYPLVWHNGSNTLWYCLLILAPAQQAVLAFATNDGAVCKAEPAFFQLAYRWLDDLC